MSKGQGQKRAGDLEAQKLDTLGSQYNQQQLDAHNLLFGSGPTSGGGAITPFLDPAALNVTNPTGVYKNQMNNANNAASTQYANNLAAIKRNAAQAGFGANAPSGFGQQQENANASALADTLGKNFETATTNQYEDAMKNFWNAVGITENAATEGQQGALTGTGNAAQTYANLYGGAQNNSAWSTVGAVAKAALNAAQTGAKTSSAG